LAAGTSGRSGPCDESGGSRSSGRIDIGGHMRSNKQFTNTTFTKRVDHEAGRHRPTRSMKEPAVCKVCGAVYADRRWTAANGPSGTEKHEPWRPSQMTVCPACT